MLKLPGEGRHGRRLQDPGPWCVRTSWPSSQRPEKLGMFQQCPVSTSSSSPIATPISGGAGGHEGTSPGVRSLGQRDGRSPQKLSARDTHSDIASYVGHEITSSAVLRRLRDYRSSEKVKEAWMRFRLPATAHSSVLAATGGGSPRFLVTSHVQIRWLGTVSERA